MDIRYKLYPYPIVSSFTNDYVNSSYDTSIEVSMFAHSIIISFESVIKNDEINHLLMDKKVAMVYHIECSQTGYRSIHKTDKFIDKFEIPASKINGRIQVCPFVVATENIQDFVSNDFHEDYNGFKFSIDQGCVLAISNQVNVDIEKTVNDLADTPSVFSIIKNEDKNERSMVVDMNHRKIIIKLIEEDFYNFKSLRKQISTQPMLNSLVVIPALIYVLEELSKRNIDDRYEYSTYSWYRAIKKAMLNNFKIDIENDPLDNLNLLKLAQQLINGPLSNALHNLAFGYGANFEEDDGSLAFILSFTLSNRPCLNCLYK